MTLKAVLLLPLAALAVGDAGAREQLDGRLDVRLDLEQPKAVLAILQKERPEAADWEKLFATAGYQRLKQREAQMKRAFTDAEFRAFVTSPDLRTRSAALAATLSAWEKVRPDAAGSRALRYLPTEATIKATIYPLIKPRENSFVFEVSSPNPAIMLYLDPAVSREQFENTLAHELHHIGYGTACPPPDVEKEIESISVPSREVLRWIGAFGEGFAMLAAAGGWDHHPHEFSKAKDKERWDRDVANAERDLATLDAFFREILDGTLDSDKAREKAFTFYGEQGAWYTVGWQMAAGIEKARGREALIATMCDPRRLLPAWNEIASASGSKALWSEVTVRAVAGQ